MNPTVAEIKERIEGDLVNIPTLDQPISGITFDTRQVKAGDLFVAIEGFASDGHDFLDSAYEQGAMASVVGKSERLAGRPGIVVDNTRAALADLAALFHGDPGRELQLVGITGTNGKTTINWIVSHLLSAVGAPNVRIGTLGAVMAGVFEDRTLTTPDPITINGCLRRGVDNGALAAVLEVSSIGLDQNRVDSLDFNVAIFTNLSRDHLDYHPDLESYYLAKKKLFHQLACSRKELPTAVVCTDDEYGKRLADELGAEGIQVVSYGASDGIESTLIGSYNSQNAAAAVAACVALGYPREKLIAACSSIPPVPGRLEPVGRDEIRVYVDYAHTPNALESALRELQLIKSGSLWVIFGCGGDRDRGKRSLMGEVAERLADKVVITSDNPRTEEPQRIVDDILEGLASKPELVEVDRFTAIEATLRSAQPGDTVLVAGKGHEDYQILGDGTIHFSDQEVVREFFAERGVVNGG